MLCMVIVIIMWYIQTVHVMEYSKPILLPPRCTFSPLFQLFNMTLALKGRWKQRKQISDHFFLYHAVAIVLRLAKSWFRIGSLEILASNGEEDLLRWSSIWFLSYMKNLRQGFQLLFLLLVLTVISWMRHSYSRSFLFSLRKVVDFVIEEHFPDLSKKTDKYLVREQ